MKTLSLYLAAFLCFLALPAMASIPLPAAPAGPAEAVQVFYTFHFKHGLGFDSASVKARKAWLTPELYTLITKALAKPVPKGDAPDIDGDLFTDSQDTPTAFHIGKATLEKGIARVDVMFTWPGEKRHITVILTQAGKEWLIQDIDYGDHRTMVKTLQDAGK